MGHRMCNIYLVLAYGLLWGIFTVYSWMMQRRQQRLEKEFADLKRALGGGADASPTAGGSFPVSH